MVQGLPHDTAFAVPADHPLRDAHHWLATRLESIAELILPTPPWIDPASPGLLGTQLRQEPAAVQLAILLACVERIAWHRKEHRASPRQPAHFALASLLATLACTLYQRRLPYTEAHLCTLLHTSMYLTGHEDDVLSPYRIALRYARRVGLTPTLLAAMQVFVTALPQGGTNARLVRRRTRLLFILVPDRPRGQRRCWSDRVRVGLQHLSATEYQAWSQLIVQMSSHQRSHGTRAWQAAAQQLLHTLGPTTIVERLQTWWPDAAVAPVWSLSPAGSHLLKHFIWLLGMIPPDATVTPLAPQLVCNLTPLDWRRQSAGQKVMRAAAAYLGAFPPAVSWAALQQVQRWSQSVEDTHHTDLIDMLIADYQARYPEITGALP